MTFLHPEFFYYMLPPLLILFTLLLTQKDKDVHFFSEEVISKLRVSENTLTLRARNALFLLMAFFIIIALAQPVIKDGEVEVKAKSADIMIALDISDSMLAEDVYPNRLELAKQKSLELLKLAPNERLGVIGFAKNSYLVSPFSFDHNAVGFLLRQLDTRSITEKGTNFLSMLDVVNKSLSKDGAKYLLIFSDGGDNKDFSKEIKLAKKNNIVVFVIGMGTLKGAPVKLEDGTFITHNSKIIVSKLNENISKLATATGGVYIQSTTGLDDVKAMLKEIENLSEQKELKSEIIQKYIPLFYTPIGIALFILLIAMSSMSKRETVSLPSVFVLFALLFTPPDAEAGLFDFLDLEDAKEAYEKKDYEKSASLYSEYAIDSRNSQSYYNAGNSLYQLGRYEEALKSYDKAIFDDKDSASALLSNIGNSYAKQGSVENLEKAIESYESSLKLKEDKNTRENLQEVKKLLKENKEESKSDEKSDEDSDESKDDKSKDGEKSDKEKSDSDEKSDKEKSEDGEESEDEKSSDEKKKENKEQNQEKSKDGDSKEDSSDENNQTQSQEKKDDNSTSKANSKQDMQFSKMSDAEEAKWLKQLQSEQNTYMYRLSDQQTKEENTDDKPW